MVKRPSPPGLQSATLFSRMEAASLFKPAPSRNFGLASQSAPQFRLGQSDTKSGQPPLLNMLRIAIIGCGKIADLHVQAINRIKGCNVVAFCDRELLMAMQLAERTGGARCFSDVSVMLGQVSPDVVHILTPPQAHYKLARMCLEAGSHVYLEKPFTVTADETDDLVRRAETS